MTPLHIETPLLRAPAGLFGHPGAVWLKMDTLQPSGSFKLRGVGRLVQHAVAAGARAIVVHGEVVEPACGAALAAIDAHARLFERFEAPLVEVCGGIGVSLAALAGWRRELGLG
jgi:cysteine synthase